MDQSAIKILFMILTPALATKHDGAKTDDTPVLLR